MSFIKSKSFVITTILFGISFLIIIAGIFQLPSSSSDSGYFFDKIFYYSIYTVFIFTGAFLVITFLRQLLWGRLFKTNTSYRSIGIFENFITASIFVLATGIMIFSVLKQPISGSWILILFLLLIVMTLLYPKLTKIFSNALISSSHPFKIGDWIKLIHKSGSNSVIGKVIEFDRLAIKLKTENDTLIIFPNVLLDSFIIENYNGLNDEIKFSFTISLDSSIQIERAKRILLSSAKQVLSGFDYLKNKAEIIINKISIDTIEYEVNFWIFPWKTISPNSIKDLILSNVQNYLSIAGIQTSFQENRQSIFKNILLFNSLTKENFEKLYETARKSFYKECTTIIKQYDDGDSMYILVEGLLNVFVKSEDDENELVKVGFITPGEYFGEMSLLTGEKRSATVIAETDSVVYEINKDCFKNILECKPELIYEISKTIAERQNINTLKLEENRNKKDSFIEKIIVKIRSYFGL